MYFYIFFLNRREELNKFKCFFYNGFILNCINYVILNFENYRVNNLVFGDYIFC